MNTQYFNFKQFGLGDLLISLLDSNLTPSAIKFADEIVPSLFYQGQIPEFIGAVKNLKG